jgi:hypothetical protein
MDEKYRRTWKEFILDNKYEMVAFDNIFSAFPGRDENSSQEYSPINTFFNQLRGENVHVIEVYHTGKDPWKGSRGSSAQEGNINTSYQLIDLREPGQKAGNIHAKFQYRKYRIYVPSDDRIKYLTPKCIRCDEIESGSKQFEWKIDEENENKVQIEEKLQNAIFDILLGEPNITMTKLHKEIKNDYHIEGVNKDNGKADKVLNWMEKRGIVIFKKNYDGELITKREWEERMGETKKYNRKDEVRFITETGKKWYADKTEDTDHFFA